MTLTAFAATAFALEDAEAPEEKLWLSRGIAPGAYRELAHRYAPFAREVLRCFVRDYKIPPRVEFDELHSAANVGLMRAVGAFEPALGYAFTTYASRRIRGAVLDEILDWLDLPGASANRSSRRGAARREGCGRGPRGYAPL